ncbi:MAG: AbrB/MazE/SpoVT family DNA-binding domain-containing protein [Crenarchaeota archaeon]|nr:AbrB/MazE/SpoVT family DNA-binding domain-containing protein [Thermoproteota archaeon]
MRLVLRVRRKGIVILPKDLREKLGISEGDELLVEAEKGKIVMYVLKPKVIDVDPKVVDEILRESRRIDEKRLEAY